MTSCRHDFESRLHRPRPFTSSTERGFISGSVLAPKRVSSAKANFKVVFFGLIVHANFDAGGNPASPRRALLVEGDTGMEHKPLLFVDRPADSQKRTDLENALKDATGNTADCSGSEYPDLCAVSIKGVAMRIRDEDGSVASGTLTNGASFDIVPSLKRREKGTDAQKKKLKPGLLTQKLPAAPIASYFEIDGGGELTACPFSGGGFFSSTPTSCDQFANDVFWNGVTKTKAVLQLAYTVDGNGDLVWKSIPTANAGQLDIGISNETAVSTGMSTAHFNLFAKVLDGGALESITRCNIPTCPSACVSCKGPKVIIPGCSDSQYP